MITPADDLSSRDECTIYKDEDGGDIDLNQSNEEGEDFLQKDLTLFSNYAVNPLLRNHLFFNNALGNFSNNFYRNNYYSISSSFSNSTANSLNVPENGASSGFQPLASSSLNQSKFQNDSINKHPSPINSFSPPSLSSNLLSATNLANKSDNSMLMTNANLAAISHAAHLYSNSFYEQYGSVNLAAITKLHQQRTAENASLSNQAAHLAMYNILMNGTILNNNHLTTNGFNSNNAIYGSDANNNQQSSVANETSNSKNSCNISFDSRQSAYQFNNQTINAQSNGATLNATSIRPRFDRSDRASAGRLANGDLNNRDLSKENHFNYSNVNNSLINQTTPHLNQKSSLLTNTNNSSSLTNHQNSNNQQINPAAVSIASLVDQPNDAFFQSYYGNPLMFNNHSLTDSKANLSIKKEPHDSLVNSKLFSSTFSHNHPFSANSLSKLHSNLNNCLTNGQTLNAPTTSLTSNLNSSGNSVFSSNGLLAAACSPAHSSSANSAASALSAFSLTESNRKSFYSPAVNTALSLSSNSKTSSPNKSTGHKSNVSAIVSKRTSTPMSTSSLTSPLMSDFNALNALNHMPFNQHLSHLNHRLSQQLNGFDIDFTKRAFLDSVNHNPLSQSSSGNLNTSNSDSLGSLNDSTGDLSDSMSKSMSNSMNHSTSDHNQPHIKKPLNAFMLFMRDNRTHVLAESTLKESAAINKKLGEMWRDLAPKEQEKYFEKAKDLRELHFKLHPNWTAKNNYAINIRKKKRKKEKSALMRQFKEYTNSGALKKCRARYGMKQRDKWCKPCLRKKKCEKYKDDPASS